MWPRRTILVELAPTLLTPDRVVSLLTELFSTLLSADLVSLTFPRRARIDPHATRSDVDALSDSWHARDSEQTRCDQPSGNDVLHV
ncbi:hypothetical protein MKK75_21855 [Methylobacterium sp. J-030]|uniref:hypothetical protein n=1 Tax=Methylobacterium sp. J-030 TaxID=2836627 RepID=UPI001FBBB4B7|nr:hypothetical protein [Methylobacterium sp. J-030]MCJ2071408.1 hypothetical protein [Methylobacterium sp. J-030]